MNSREANLQEDDAYRDELQKALRSFVPISSTATDVVCQKSANSLQARVFVSYPTLTNYTEPFFVPSIELTCPTPDQSSESKIKAMVDQKLVDQIKRYTSENSGLKFQPRKWEYDLDYRRKGDSPADYYIGTWVGLQKHGFGMYVWRDQRRYVGEWKKDQMHGIGSYIIPCADPRASTNKTEFTACYHYEGFFQNGKRNGLGWYKWPDQRIYVGGFYNDTIHGYGTLTWADGSYYQGMFQGGRMHGHGLRVWSDRSYYFGLWEENKKHGEGTYVYSDQRSKYSGGWVQGAMSGKGKMEWVTVDKDEFPLLDWYEGSWKDGRRCGKGTYVHRDGTTFAGVWKDDKPIRGVYTTPLGRKIKGEKSSLAEELDVSSTM